jgi:NAD(P)-dependent dehydrogenase (short-subunit alcohol dehydrogenase family)
MSGPVGGQRLAGKVAIVTGAGGGIGREHALLLAQQGARVVVNDLGVRADASADAVVEEIRAAGGEATASTDSATWDAAPAIVETALGHYGAVDILVNNATFTCFGDTREYEEANWDTTFDVNLKGYFAMTQAVAPHLIARGGGAIVNTSSGSGAGAPAHAAYASAKEGVLGLTRSVARELGRFDVRCNAIRPIAATNTAGSFNGRAGKWARMFELTMEPRLFSAVAAMASNPDLMAPHKVAPIAVWLCTDAARNVNGQVFEIHGDTVNRVEAPAPVRTVYRPGGWDLDSLDLIAPEALVDGLHDEFALIEHPELRDPAY